MYIDTKSSEDKYIIKARPEEIRKYGNRFPTRIDARDFFKSLERMVKENEIGVYTANARKMQIPNKPNYQSRAPENADRGFYSELEGFINKGHIVGPHGGMTMHMRALDGSRIERFSYGSHDEYVQEGFVIVDPKGESYPVSLNSLVMINSSGIRGDVFDYLFRVSPKEVDLLYKKNIFSKLFHKL